MSHKKKIINDPVFGFITIPNAFIASLIQHPYFQRLSRIKQLGLASFVYPGAQHTRLHHSLGAMYLMGEAIAVLRAKGHEITEQEATSALTCILLHDIGHGPFSHVLEYTLTDGIHHEEFSLALMHSLNNEYDGQLDMCISIFRDEYPKRFLYQLVSGQLDMDRLDYLRRDSFFTGVTEGNIGSMRIIKMLDLCDDNLVVEVKGIYSIENFLMARRLMYWQVYLHKTAVASEKMLINTLKRAKELSSQGICLFASPHFNYFLENQINTSFFEENKAEVLSHFINIDDSDIWCTLKVWSNNSDKVLSTLSTALISRNLFKIELSSDPICAEKKEKHLAQYQEKLGMTPYEASYLVSQDIISSNMYNELDDSISILLKDGNIKDISQASDMLNIDLLSKNVEKYYLTYYNI